MKCRIAKSEGFDSIESWREHNAEVSILGRRLSPTDMTDI